MHDTHTHHDVNVGKSSYLKNDKLLLDLLVTNNVMSTG